MSQVSACGGVLRSTPFANRVEVRSELRKNTISLIGAGTGGGSVDRVETLMTDQLSSEDFVGRVVLVRFVK